jgi:UDPglucose 6-dehydrogenase
MYRIAVAGTGYVGLTAGVCFAEAGHQVVCVDQDEKKINRMMEGKAPIYEPGLEELMQKNFSAGRLTYTTDYRRAYKNADTIFIGVGTPEQPDGSADLSAIASAARQIAESVDNDCLIVVKSTVPIGTADKVEQLIYDFLQHEGDKDTAAENSSFLGGKIRAEVASNPEFLSQGTAIYDTLHAARIIIGTKSKWAEDRLKEIYEPFGLPIVSVSRRSAEMIKYACNDFLALKISYMNEIANLCERVGADIEDVAEGMSFDERIGRRFLNAGIGYGGSCLPKDTKALAYLAGEYGCELRTVKAAMDVNREQKIILYKKAKRRVITFNGLKIAVLGLTFKPGTDDLREAPSLENIPLLLEQGADIYAYDPAGIGNFKEIYPQGKSGRGTIRYVESGQAALDGASLCFIFTEWNEIKVIQPSDYKNLMKTPLVFDGRNIYQTRQMKEAGVEYHSIGR